MPVALERGFQKVEGSVLILIVLGVAVAIGIPLWGIIDAAQRPAETFKQIGSDKTRWVLLIVLLTVLFNVGGIIASIVYLASVRPRLRAADAAALDSAAPVGEVSISVYRSALASDADRDRAAQQLQHHFEVGRLSLDDFRERVETALSARTVGELADLTLDLPGT